MWRQIFKKVQIHLQADSGSAIVEFVALAIPLFIPIFIYLNQFSSVSVNEEIARTMSREVLRVYVLSENDAQGQELSSKALQIIAHKMKLKSREVDSLRIDTQCSQQPCLSASGKIQLTISFRDDATGRIIRATTQQHLSPWL